MSEFRLTCSRCGERFPDHLPSCNSIKENKEKDTRRFTAAVAVLQGLVTGKQTMPVLDEDIAAEQAIQAYYAVLQADALLEELSK